MRVAFITDSYLPNVDGVVETILYLEEALPKKGYDIPLIVMPSETGKPYVKKSRGKTIYALKSHPLPFYPKYRVGVFTKGDALRLFEKFGIDIVHNHGLGITALSAGRAAKELSLPRISTFHTNILEATHYLGPIGGLAKLSGKRYIHKLFSYYDEIVAPSRYTADYLRRFVDVPENKLRVIPNGIDLQRFPYSAKKRAKNRFLHVGRVVKEKNIDWLMLQLDKLARKGDDISLTVVGNGPYLEKLKELSRQLTLDVDFTGYVPNEELYKVYAEHTALLFASTFDTQGLVVFESMAVGTPVLARRGTSAEEFVNGCGGVFTNGSDLKKAISSLPSICPRKRRKEFSYKMTAARYAAIYNKLLRMKYI